MIRISRLLFLILTLSIFPVYSSFSADLESAEKSYDAGEYEDAFIQFLELAEKGDVEAQFWIGYLFQDGEGVAKDLEESFSWFKSAADNGHAQSQNHVGMYYYYGNGVKANTIKALEYLLMSAEQEGDFALFNLENVFNDIFYNQKIDYEKAFEILQKSAKDGYKIADYYLSFFYQHGLGVEEDPQTANQLTENAAKAGYVHAQSRIAEMYNYGYGEDSNLSLAFQWYMKAAAQEDAFSIWMVGIFYVEGKVVDLNYVEAVKWFEIATEKGLPEGITSLAVMYANGEGVQQDYLKSHDLYLQIATKGFAHAQRALGQMYYHGQGVKSNLPFAKMWLDLAAEQGHEVATQEASNLVGEMSEEQLAKAKEMKIRMKKEIEKNLENY